MSTAYVERDELFDGLGRKIQVQQATATEGTRRFVGLETAAYDDRGQVVERYEPFVFNTQQIGTGGGVDFIPPTEPATTLHYDALGRLIQSDLPSGSSAKADYSVPWQVTLTDACYEEALCKGGKTVQFLDAFQRVIKRDVFEGGDGSADNLLARTRYEFDGEGRLRESEQWEFISWNFNTRIRHSYDSMGRKVQTIDPDSGTWNYGYDRVGNLVYQDDPKTGQHIELCYDSLNRITAKFLLETGDSYEASCADPSLGDAVYTYDDPAVAYGTGKLTAVVDSTGATLFHGYNAFGDVTWREKQIWGQASLESATFLYEFDDHGNLERITYPDEEVVKYEYDEVGRVRGLVSLTDSRVYLADQTYDRYGRIRQLTHGNGPGDVGVVETREYHAAAQAHEYGRLSRITIVPPAGATGVPSCGSGAHLFDAQYNGYSPTGKLVSVNDSFDPAIGSPAGCEPLNISADYQYDGAGRLYEVTGNARLQGSYRYDQLGNLELLDGSVLEYHDDSPHQLEFYDGIYVVEHDANGNRSNKNGVQNTFDLEDRLTAVGGLMAAEYDYSGRMVLKHDAATGSVRRYFDELAEYRVEDNAPILTKYYFAGGRRIASRSSHWLPDFVFAAAEPEASIFASVEMKHVAALLFVAALFWPERRRRHYGRKAPHAGVAVANSFAFLAVTILGPVAGTLDVTPVAASGGGADRRRRRRSSRHSTTTTTISARRSP